MLFESANKRTREKMLICIRPFSFASCSDWSSGGEKDCKFIYAFSLTGLFARWSVGMSLGSICSKVRLDIFNIRKLIIRI